MQDQADVLQDHLLEMSKPLARYKDDEDLDQMMREMEREEDPMLAFIKKKKKKKSGTSVQGLLQIVCNRVLWLYCFGPGYISIYTFKETTHYYCSNVI